MSAQFKSELPYGARKFTDVLDESLAYIEDRRTGKISSFKTPWSGFNNAGINGLEWGSMLTVAARPGAGKTMITSQILRESYIHNPKAQFNILEFQFEMGAKQYGAREFAAEVAMDYNLVLSSHTPLDEATVKRLKEYRRYNAELEAKKIHRLFISKPLGHESIYNAIHHYYNDLGGAPLLVTIDHSWLIKKSATEKEKIATLYNTVEMLMQIKNEIPIIVVMLSQLNRTIDEASRKTPGHIGNYPTSGDIFGGDALMQGSDMVVILNRPHKSNIFVYGPKKFVANTEDIFMHMIKVRNGSNDEDILFYKAQFNRQRIIETVAPATNGQGVSAPNGYTMRNQTGLNLSSDLGPKM